MSVHERARKAASVLDSIRAGEDEAGDIWVGLTPVVEILEEFGSSAYAASVVYEDRESLVNFFPTYTKALGAVLEFHPEAAITTPREIWADAEAGGSETCDRFLEALTNPQVTIFVVPKYHDVTQPVDEDAPDA